MPILIRTSGGGASVPGACRSGLDVSHPSFGLLVVLPDTSLVRFKTSIFFGKPRLAGIVLRLGGASC